MRRAVVLVIAASALLSCSGAPKPVAVSDSDACAFCRMAVSDKHFAAELVAPGEEPRIYDDIGCLVSDLVQHPAPGEAVAFVADHRTGDWGEAVAFVADHRTGDWIAAPDAIYTRVPELSTPMGSHIIAHMSPASRDADAAARSGVPLSSTDVFGPAGPPGASRGR